MDQSVSMQHLVTPNGKHNIFGWVIFISTVVLILFSIYQAYKSIAKMQKEETVQERKMKELELNVRSLRGDLYQTIV